MNTQNCPYGNMPREAGAGHWRDWHRGHGCHLDPSRGERLIYEGGLKALSAAKGSPSAMSDDSTKSKGDMTFIEALSSRRPMRRVSRLSSAPWLFLGRANSEPLAAPTWRRIDTGEATTLAHEDYTADDWEVLP
jgi:hypothetical protein